MTAYTPSILSTLDTVDFTLLLTFAARELHQDHVTPVLFSIIGSDATCHVVINAAAYDVVDRVRTGGLLNDDDSLLAHLPSDLDTIFGGIEDLLAAVRGKKLDKGGIGTRLVSD